VTRHSAKATTIVNRIATPNTATACPTLGAVATRRLVVADRRDV
jgi:hypothetical protein